MSFAVIVVNYGSHALLARNLPAAADLARGRVYVVDNPSSTSECEAIRKLCAERGWSLVESPVNDGFGPGVNRGLKAAVADGIDVFVLLNPDASAEPAVLDSLAQAVEQDRRAVVSPRIVTSSGRVVFPGGVVSLRTGRTRMRWIPDDDPEWACWLTGACMAFDRGTFEATGGFAEHYFLYWEDVDFSRRAVAAGRHLVLRGDLSATHDEGGTQGAPGGRAKSHSYYYWNARNRLLFGRRFARVPWRSWLASTPAQTRQILLRGGRRQILSDPGVLTAVLGGMTAGLLVAGRRHPGGGEGASR